MSTTNLLNSDKGQNFLPPPAIFLSEATSDGEDTTDDNNAATAQGPRLVKCEAVLTDVEYSSDEEEGIRKCVSPVAVNCSSESQVVERIFEPNTQNMDDELTDTENLYASDDDFVQLISEEKGNEIEECEDGVTTISDQIKTNNKIRNRFGNVPKNVDIKHPRNDFYSSSCKKINHDDNSTDKDYLTPVNKLAKKKKRKGKLLLESCLTDTEDVDVPSDVDDLNRVVKKDVSYNLFPSEKEEQDYTNRIKHTSSLRGTEKFTLMEFLTNKLEEGGVTDIDELAYSDGEDLVDAIKETEYELDFYNETSNKETVVQIPPDRKTKKKRNTRTTPESADTDDEESTSNPKCNQRVKSEPLTANHLSVNKSKSPQPCEDISTALTDTEDLSYSDGECGSSRPKCPTPDMAYFENSTTLQNESVKILQALEVISDADPLTDCEEFFLSTSPRRPKKVKPIVTISSEGHTDTEDIFLSDGNMRYSEMSDSGDNSCSETDVEVCSNIGEIEEVRRRAPSITPECLRNLDNTYISNVEGSEAYLKQIKSNKSRSLSGPPVICTTSSLPIQDTDSEEIQTEDETAEEFCYSRSCTPSNYFEKFNLEDQSCVIHEKSTRSFQTDGAESLHIKDPSYQQDPVTDSEEVPLLD